MKKANPDWWKCKSILKAATTFLKMLQFTLGDRIQEGQAPIGVDRGLQAHHGLRQGQFLAHRHAHRHQPLMFPRQLRAALFAFQFPGQFRPSKLKLLCHPLRLPFYRPLFKCVWYQTSARLPSSLLAALVIVAKDCLSSRRSKTLDRPETSPWH